MNSNLKNLIAAVVLVFFLLLIGCTDDQVQTPTNEVHIAPTHVVLHTRTPSPPPTATPIPEPAKISLHLDYEEYPEWLITKLGYPSEHKTETLISEEGQYLDFPEFVNISIFAISFHPSDERNIEIGGCYPEVGWYEVQFYNCIPTDGEMKLYAEMVFCNAEGDSVVCGKGIDESWLRVVLNEQEVSFTSAKYVDPQARVILNEIITMMGFSGTLPDEIVPDVNYLIR